MVKFLTIKPADLTVLTRNNQGGFPFLKVFQTIDGRQVVSGHGDRPMPIWGDRYIAQSKLKYGPYGGETAARARILELVYYVQQMQR